jgi:hypothetical protein
VRYLYEPDWRALFGVDTDARPDYLVEPDGARAICEVKEFTTTRITDHLTDAGGTASLSDKEVFGPVRSAMTSAAREQLLPFAGLGVPLVVVLANPHGADVSLDDEHVSLAIMGNLKVRIKVGPNLPPADEDAEWIADGYGAFISVLDDGRLENRNPHVSAVVVVHERDHRSDWIERVLADEPEVESFESTRDAMAAYLRAVDERQERGEAPEGSYRWVEVFDLSGNPTPPGFQGTPLPRELFDGPRDRWFGFVGDAFAEIT